MDLRKKINFTFIPLLICLILLFSASYAWLTMSLAPEVTSIDTNVGSNGSLEIALLSENTYVDPQLIRTIVGGSAEARDVLESNQSWGNVIELSDERYGLGQLSLLPARLNLVRTEEGTCAVDGNLMKVAEFGIDGRITILSSQTVSAPYEEDDFTYHVDSQRYGVRAIGTISHIAPQQTALAGARTATQAHTASASRTVKNTWRDNGAMLMDIFKLRYGTGAAQFTADQVGAVRDTAMRMQDAVEYAELTLRQGVIGVMASVITDNNEFENMNEMLNNSMIPLSEILNAAGSSVPEAYMEWARKLEDMKSRALRVVTGCVAYSRGCSWEELEPLLDLLVDAERVYLGDRFLSAVDNFEDLEQSNTMTVPPKSGLMAEIAEFAGNYSSFFRWTDTVNIEVVTADPVQTPHLIVVVNALKNCTAASGGWTRADLDDTYSFAMDMAFRCNADTDLLLQTVPALRLEEDAEFPATQGGGSFMRFSSEDMTTERLVQLMDTIRIGFLNDRNELIALAKLNTSNYEQQEDGVAAPLYLYEYSLEETGVLTVGERLKDDATILPLSKNAPAVVTVVVWLDGDHVDNSYVSHLSERSMSGIMNLQFASSADLKPSKQPIDS